METQKIGGIWVKEREDGSKQSSGVIKYKGEKLHINIFPNDYKKPDNNQPNYNIVLWKAELIEDMSDVPC